MDLNCFNLQYILVLIKYTEISNFNTSKLIYLLKIQYLKKGSPSQQLK